jgi:hypothetical protein
MRRMRADLMARPFGDAAQRQGIRPVRTAGWKLRRIAGLKRGKGAYARMAQGRPLLPKHARPALFCKVKGVPYKLFAFQPAFQHGEIAFLHVSGIFPLPPSPCGLFISGGGHDAGTSLIQPAQQAKARSDPLRREAPQHARQTARRSAGKAFRMQTARLAEKKQVSPARKEAGRISGKGCRNILCRVCGTQGHKAYRLPAAQPESRRTRNAVHQRQMLLPEPAAPPQAQGRKKDGQRGVKAPALLVLPGNAFAR